MKLISTLLSIFGIVIVVGLPASLVSAIVLNTLMGGRGLVLPPFLYLIAVIGSFLAMSVTMVGRCPLWQVAGVAVISMCVMYLGREVHLTKELTAFGWIVFCISAIPFLTLRLCGLRFVDMPRHNAAQDVRFTPGRSHETMTPSSAQGTGVLCFRLIAMFSTVAAVAVLLGSLRVLFVYYPADRIVRNFVNRGVGGLIVFVSLIFPLAILEATSTSTRAARGGMVVTFVCGLGAAYRPSGSEWTIAAGLIVVPTLCSIVAGRLLRGRGFRVAKNPVPIDKQHVG